MHVHYGYSKPIKSKKAWQKYDKPFLTLTKVCFPDKKKWDQLWCLFQTGDSFPITLVITDINILKMGGNSSPPATSPSSGYTKTSIMLMH